MVTKSGTGTGTVTSSPAGINCGSTCVATFANGTTVTLTARRNGRNRFVGWSGDCSGTANCVLSMTTDHAVTATFNTR
jgi:endoglucanase